RRCPFRHHGVRFCAEQAGDHHPAIPPEGDAVVAERGTRTNVELLGLTQEFLRSEVRRQAPDSLLSTVWDEFYRVYNELLRRFAVARGLRGADVDDCLQEVWFEISR